MRVHRHRWFVYFLDSAFTGNTQQRSIPMMPAVVSQDAFHRDQILCSENGDGENEFHRQ